MAGGPKCLQWGWGGLGWGVGLPQGSPSGEATRALEGWGWRRTQACLLSLMHSPLCGFGGPLPGTWVLLETSSCLLRLVPGQEPAAFCPLPPGSHPEKAGVGGSGRDARKRQGEGQCDPRLPVLPPSPPESWPGIS